MFVDCKFGLHNIVCGNEVRLNAVPSRVGLTFGV